MAERGGFEPPVPLLGVHTISSRAPSTARSPLQSRDPPMDLRVFGRYHRVIWFSTKWRSSLEISASNEPRRTGDLVVRSVKTFNVLKRRDIPSRMNSKCLYGMKNYLCSSTTHFSENITVNSVNKFLCRKLVWNLCKLSILHDLQTVAFRLLLLADNISVRSYCCELFRGLTLQQEANDAIQQQGSR